MGTYPTRKTGRESFSFKCWRVFLHPVSFEMLLPSCPQADGRGSICRDEGRLMLRTPPVEAEELFTVHPFHILERILLVNNFKNCICALSKVILLKKIIRICFMKCGVVKLKVVPHLSLSLLPFLFPVSFLYLNLIYRHKERDLEHTGRW